MTHEVKSNRFQASNRSEKLFRLHYDFTVATFQTIVRHSTCANDGF